MVEGDLGAEEACGLTHISHMSNEYGRGSDVVVVHMLANVAPELRLIITRLLILWHYSTPIFSVVFSAGQLLLTAY